MTQSNKTETLGFQAEVKQLLRLVTHSLYSNREIFLRELISNASDAADKLRFAALAQPDLYAGDTDLKIWVDFDAKAKTITIRDNGIGMSREEVVANLGTIAKSGTKDFLAALDGKNNKDLNLIGQFGVGFYSSFVVAKNVIVKTRRAGLSKEQGVLWESQGEGDFSVGDLLKEDRGTEVVLYLKDEETDLLDYWRLQQIIVKYSDHIMLPIVMQKPLAEKETVAQQEVVNKATALWTLPKKEIKDDDYKALYRHISHDFDGPLIWSHHQVEGKLEYIALLYIPSHAPFDFWTREKRRGLKLYVQRVFISDDAEQLLPNYLRFVQGIVDAKDLPLNVSREILQNNRVLKQIRTSIIKRVLDMLEKMAAHEVEKYTKFWQAFGNALKEGLIDDYTERTRIAGLLRFASTQGKGEDATVSLDEYLKRMLPEQDKIYYITAENLMAANNSPYLEVFRQHNIEVLFLTDRIDEWWLAHYAEHQGKKFQAVTQGDVDLNKLIKRPEVPEEKTAQHKEDYTHTLQEMEKILTDQISKVRLSERLTDSPVCIVTTEKDLSFNMQRIMGAFGQNVPQSKPILEINPNHSLIAKLPHIEDKELFAQWTRLFYEQALLLAGGKIEDVAAFTQRINKLLSLHKV